MISKTIKIGLVILALFSFSLGTAQDKKGKRKPNPEKAFKKLDSNADGAVTLEEFKAKRLKDESKAAKIEKRFAKMDTDGNGTLDLAEFKAAIAKMKERKQ